MAEALARLWTRFLPEIEQRVSIIEAAAKALTAGSLEEPQREAAHAAAHKLAGTLGTFGLHRGTEIAREAELLLQKLPLSDAASLGIYAKELHAILDANNCTPPTTKS
jgi:HPt (histidine-containing phosphotransfer) domain-containing protein